MPSSSSKADALKPYRFRVFVYGTLRPGGYYYRQICQGRVSFSLPALMRGRLFHLDAGYPALCKGDDWVRGDVLAFHDPHLMDDIDTLEGYDPTAASEPSEYERRTAPAFDLDHQFLGKLAAYWMTPERIAAEGGQYVVGGDWHQWNGSRRLT